MKLVATWYPNKTTKEPIPAIKVEFERRVAERCLVNMGSISDAIKYRDSHMKHGNPLCDHWDRMTKLAILEESTQMLSCTERTNLHVHIEIK